jgi:hypothetical protein
MADEDITIAGKTIAMDFASVDGEIKRVARDKIGWGAPGYYQDADIATPMPVQEGGTFGYASGTSPATVDVPAGARLQRVSVIAGLSVAATVTIGAGNTITIPAGAAFDENVPGQALGADVVIGGTIQSYYVAWLT